MEIFIELMVAPGARPDGGRSSTHLVGGGLRSWWLLEFDAQRAEVWHRESNAFTGMKLLFGGAEIRLS